MTTAFAALREANREIIARLDEREQELLAREKALAADMEKVISERRGIVADRDTIQKAEAVQARLLGVETPASNPAARNTVYELGRTASIIANAWADAAAAKEVQSRARVGPQRYAMLATLRTIERMSAEEIAAATGLSLNRVKEQLRSDTPTYVIQETLLGSPDGELKFQLTDAGADLLKRFENYRKSQGKALPSLTPSENAADDDEIDPAHSKSEEAGAQGPLARP
jgi:DNA-directed RNA polymerase specialized sigma24 family protein